MVSVTKTKLHRGPKGWAICKAERRECPFGAENHIEVTGSSAKALAFLNEGFGINEVPEDPTVGQPATSPPLDLMPGQVQDSIRYVIGFLQPDIERELVEAVMAYCTNPGYTYNDRYELVEAALARTSDDSVFQPRYSRAAARMIFLKGGVATSVDDRGRISFYNLRDELRYFTAEAYEIEQGDVLRFEADGEVFHAEVLENVDSPVASNSSTLARLQRAFTDPTWRRDLMATYGLTLSGPQQVLRATQVGPRASLR